MYCDVHYYPAKFKIKSQPMYEETKKQIILWDKMN